MTTFTGRSVNPLDVRRDQIDIWDIAHALSSVNRFGGHAKIPINVAQHSVYVSKIVTALCPPEIDDPQLSLRSLQGLLHDASEAYLGDIVHWLKKSDAFAMYREAEQVVQTRVFEEFGCALEQHPDVDRADIIMVKFEAAQSGLNLNAPGIYVEPLTDAEVALVGQWHPWSWITARTAFLERFSLLTGREV
jgi:hypothetical protein